MAKRTLNGNHHLGFTLCSLILVTLYFASISNVTHTTWTCYNSLITTEDEQYRLAVVNNTTDLATRKPIVCPLFIPYKSIKRSVVPRDCKQSRFCIIYFMLLLSGNIELNPGPGHSIFPCGYCQLDVSWDCSGVACDNCEVWFHRSCADISKSGYRKLSEVDVSWRCHRCCHTNSLNSHLFSYEIDLSNRFSILSEASEPTDVHNTSVQSHISSFSPNVFSTPTGPIGQSSRALPRSKQFSSSCSHDSVNNSIHISGQCNHAKAHNSWRSLVVNCNSIAGKRAELANLINYTDPDVLISTETKLDDSIKNSEFLPAGYQGTARRDRTRSGGGGGGGGGGVMLAFKSCYEVEEIEIKDINAETAWASVNNGINKMVFGVFYRPPSSDISYFEQLETAIQQVVSKFKNNPNITYILGGDFNAGDIDWETGTVLPNSSAREINERVLGLNQLFDLNQMHREPTREDRLLDLFFTNKPNLVKASRTIPGLSDHEIVMVDSDIKAHINTQAPRHIHLWSKADWQKIKDEASAFRLKFLDNIGNYSVNANYVKFKNFINDIINKHVPTRAMRSPKHNLPWITQKIRRMCRKKQRLFNKAKRSCKSKDWNAYKAFKNDTNKALRRAHWQYVNNILLEGLQSKDCKPFWRYVKSKRQDIIGVAPLKSRGNLFSDSKSKATILNDQFKSCLHLHRTQIQTSLYWKVQSTPWLHPLLFHLKG